jgi:hypothetical protein
MSNQDDVDKVAKEITDFFSALPENEDDPNSFLSRLNIIKPENIEIKPEGPENDDIREGDTSYDDYALRRKEHHETEVNYWKRRALEAEVDEHEMMASACDGDYPESDLIRFHTQSAKVKRQILEDMDDD